MRILPKLARNLERIDAGGLPPSPLVASAMSCTVMNTAERNRELIARLATKRPGLHEPQMMRIRGLTGAQEARLEGNVAKMLLIAVATWRANREHALVDTIELKLVGRIAVRVDFQRPLNRRWRRLDDWRLDRFNCRCQQLGKLLFKRVFHQLGVGRG